MIIVKDNKKIHRIRWKLSPEQKSQGVNENLLQHLNSNRNLMMIYLAYEIYECHS